jgi:uncharacterized protein YbjT (DUF2867 family)
MKMVVIGGTGLIGSKTVATLRQGGHEVVAASPKSGVNSITGEGLKEAMAGAQVAIDLTNSPSFEDRAVMRFFETSGHNLLLAETEASVRHHVALSIVAIDRTDNGYFRAKAGQEKLVEASGITYTIICATQFLEFLGGIADESADGNTVRLPPVAFQPIAAEDVAAMVAEVALAAPRNGIVEIAGQERAPLNDIVARYLKAAGDPREVVGDPKARYWVAGSKSSRSCRWAKRGLAASVLTSGSAEHRQAPNPASAHRRKRLNVSCPVCAAYRYPTIRQCLRGCARVEKCQSDPRLPARATECPRQEHEGRARRIRSGWLLALSQAS